MDNEKFESPSNENEGSDKENTIKQETSKEIKENIAKTPRELADEAVIILNEEFWKDFNLVKQDGIRKYHIARKDIVIQWKGRPLIPVEGKTVLGEGQMIMEINSKGKLKIRLNSDAGDVMYNAQDLSNDDLTTELPALKMFIEQGTAMPATSKFIEQKNTSGYTDQDIEEILKGYEKDPNGSKPK